MTAQTVIEFGEEHSTVQKQIKYPFAALFHIFFRALSIITYLFCSLLTSSYIISFIVILILLALDFWTVKNITGRLLVGLRWWNLVDENGQNHWIFESRKENNQVMSMYPQTSMIESQIFWAGLTISPLIWGFLLFIDLFTFKFAWMIIVIMGLILNCANLYGYIRCKMGDNTEIKSKFSSFLSSRIISSMFRTQQSAYNSQMPAGSGFGVPPPPNIN